MSDESMVLSVAEGLHDVLSVSEALEDHNQSDDDGDRDKKLIDYLYMLFEIEKL